MNAQAVGADREAVSPPALLELLASRLPAIGRVLVLERDDAGGDRLASPTRAIERRRLDEARALDALEPSAWHAIVVAGHPADGWPALLRALRVALAESGRLHLVLPLDAVDGAADAVGALYEAAYCLLHEEEVALERLDGEERSTLAAPSRRAVVATARADEHVVRSYRDGDEDAILRLFGVAFSPPRGIEHWRWKYRDNPFGALAISCAFSASGELAAHYAAYPVPFRRAAASGGQTLLCHQVGDTMTDRRHRDVGRGRTSLLARTARHFYARRCERKVAFNYGFNTGNIQRFSQLFVGARKVWDLELRSCRASELRLARPRRFRPYRVSRARELDRAFDLLFERVAADYGLLVERRRPYLDWRYLRCPDRDFELLRVEVGARLVGWGVFRRDGARLLWGDALIERSHPGAVSALLRHALAATGGGVTPPERVEGWFSRHPAWWSEWLDALGFTASPEPQQLGMVYVPFLEDPLEELRRRYYLTMGDSDLF